MSGKSNITHAIEGYPAEQNICKISAHRPDVNTVRIIVIKFAPFAITPIKEIAAKARYTAAGRHSEDIPDILL